MMMVGSDVLTLLSSDIIVEGIKIISISARAHLFASNKMEYIIDLQGFQRSSNLFIVKEVAIVRLESDAQPLVYHFAPPCGWKKLLCAERSVNRWLELNYHGIPWSSGVIPYSSMTKVFQDSLEVKSKIYVKGLEKKKWLEEILPGRFIYNIELWRCPALKTLDKETTSCIMHTLRNWKRVCAVENALSLKTWFMNYEEKHGRDGTGLYDMSMYN